MKRQRPRTCVGCREESRRREMVRIARKPDGDVVIDPSGRVPGRGAYVCAREECVREARKRDALSRALKVRVPSEAYDALLEMIIERSGEAEG